MGSQGPGNADPEASRSPENRDPETQDTDAQGPGFEASGSRNPNIRVPENGTPYPHTPHSPQESPDDGRTQSSRKRRRRKTEPHREDVERVCAHLADKVEENGSKRPTITNEWRREARLLLDEKRPIPVTVDRVINAIDWATADHFWHRNILSMPKLRKQWERLRLDRKAELEGKPRQNGHASTSSKPIPRNEQCPRHRGQPGGTRDDGEPKCGQCRAETRGRRTS